MNPLTNRARAASRVPASIERVFPGTVDFFTNFGHRNWIVIADSAYPLHANAAVITCSSEMGILETLDLVLEIMRERANVRPVVYLDSELAFVSEQHAPGIDAFNRTIRSRVARCATAHLAHSELIQKVDDAAHLFRVLVIKTNSTLPYSSVFLEAGCRYWTDEAEACLRNAMAKAAEGSK